MPVADFPGTRNWGYDGVLPYAPDSSYGRPDDLKALVEAAHARGLMVLLDVMYNHFGPDGNYLSLYAPQFFTDRHKTPWGAAINYRGRTAARARVRDPQRAVLDRRIPHGWSAAGCGPRHPATIVPWISCRNWRSACGLRPAAPCAPGRRKRKKHAFRLTRQAGRRPALVHSAMERRCPSCAAHRGNRRIAYLLRPYCGDTEKLARALAEGFVQPRAAVRRASAAGGVCRLYTESRSDR